MAHAYLAQKLISIGGPGNLKTHIDDTNFKDLFDYYTKYVKIIDNKHVYTAAQNSVAHHNLMADKLITDIAQGIRGYVETNTPYTKNDADITLETYKAAAWSGLRSTDAFTKLPKDKQNAILVQERLLISGTEKDCR